MAYVGQYGSTSQHLDVLERFLLQVAEISGRCAVPADRLCTAVSPSIRHIPTFGGEVELDDVQRAAMQMAPVVFLEFTADVEVNEQAAFENFHPLGDRTQALRNIAERRLSEAVASVGLAIYIATPGDIHLSAPEFQSERSRDLRREWGELRVAPSSEENAWPRLVRIPVVQVVDWLDGLPGWNRSISEGRVARAVAALSQALAADRESGGGSAMPLVWCMVGLEALYCRDSEGLRLQLIRHSQLLLGPMTENNRKRFGKVYDYRSKFLHGGLELPFAHREAHSPEDDVWQFIWDSDAEAGLAFATLLATIQQLVIRRSHTLEFVTDART